MKLLLTILTIGFLIPCTENSTEKKATELEETSLKKDSEGDEWNYREVNKKYLDSLNLDVCSTQDVEFMDLYPVLDSIASDKYENLILVDSLKSKGFEAKDWRRGNWMEGPRIISVMLSNGNCECQVDKLYYSTDQEGQYKVTERLKCK